MRLGFRFVDIGVRIELALKIISRQNLFKVGIGGMGRGPAEIFPPIRRRKRQYLVKSWRSEMFSERVEKSGVYLFFGNLDF